MDAIEALKQEIAALEKKIAARRDALRVLQKGEAIAGSPELRFYDWRPLDAIRVLLQERGEKMTRHELYKELLAGGIAIDRKRAGHNLRLSIDKNIALGNLLDAGDDYIDLPSCTIPPSDK